MTEKKIAAMSFEEALRELEGIVDQLEKGEVPLEQSIALYERGDALKRHCETKLKEAELKVERIVAGEGDAAEAARGDAVRTEPFNTR